MKTILSLVTLLLLGSATSYAQFSSSPMEPGLRDHLRGHKGSAVTVVNDRAMLINGISTDWVSQDQITLSAVVVELKRLSDASRERIAREIVEYNVSSAVGTLEMENGTVRMIHHLNPRFVSPAQITSVVATFKAAVERERADLDRSMAALR